MKNFGMSTEEIILFIEALPNNEGTASVKEEAGRYKSLKTEADSITGGRGEGSGRYVKIPLLYGVTAILVFLGIILCMTGVSVIGGILSILTGTPIFLISAELFLKMKKTQRMYKEADDIKERLCTFIEKTDI